MKKKEYRFKYFYIFITFLLATFLIFIINRLIENKYSEKKNSVNVSNCLNFETLYSFQYYFFRYSLTGNKFYYHDTSSNIYKFLIRKYIEVNNFSSISIESLTPIVRISYTYYTLSGDKIVISENKISNDRSFIINFDSKKDILIDELIIELFNSFVMKENFCIKTDISTLSNQKKLLILLKQYYIIFFSFFLILFIILFKSIKTKSAKFQRLFLTITLSILLVSSLHGPLEFMGTAIFLAIFFSYLNIKI
jgi:hypothetical protein